MRALISALAGFALILATALSAGAAAPKHKSHKAPKTEYLRAAGSGPAQPGH